MNNALKKLSIAILAFLAVTFEISFFSNLFPFFIVAGVALVLTVIWSIRHDFEKIWPRIVFLGLVLDFLSLKIVGASVVSFAVVSYLSGIFAGRFSASQKTMAFLAVEGFVIFATAVNFLIAGGLVLASGYFLKDTHAPLAVIFSLKMLTLNMFCNLIVFAALYWPVNKLENKLISYA